MQGEATILLSEKRQNEIGVPYLKPCNESGVTIQVYKTPFVIGSLEDAVDAVLQEKGISRFHASIEQEGGSFYIRDLDSTNGTKWNGELLQPQAPKLLGQGDWIVMGSQEYQFMIK